MMMNNTTWVLLYNVYIIDIRKKKCELVSGKIKQKKVTIKLFLMFAFKDMSKIK